MSVFSGIVGENIVNQDFLRVEVAFELSIRNSSRKNAGSRKHVRRSSSNHSNCKIYTYVVDLALAS